MPNVQAPTQLFYHEHALGDTRLGVYAGLAGAAYMIRDPSSALDGPNTPLPTGAFEIPLVLTDRAFFTDGELNFPENEHQRQECVLAGRATAPTPSWSTARSGRT
jgi:spore coat protein A